MRAFLVLSFFAANAASAPAPYGILLMAHGGDASWNEEIARLRARVDAKIPTETALGMADPAALQAAVDRLVKRGAPRIVAVPLFVQSRSEVMDQTRFVLGLSDSPSEALRAAYARIGAAHAAHGAHGGHAAHAASKAPGAGAHRHAWSVERVKTAAPIALARALDDHELIGRILLERAKALSKEPAKESVVLVAHGPVDDAALPAWNDSLRSLCGAVAEGRFKDCGWGVLRDDAAPEIRAAAVAELRARVARAGTAGRALVIPVLIARGGIERKIVKDLEGLDYSWDGKTLMPHPGFDAWVLERAASAQTGSR